MIEKRKFLRIELPIILKYNTRKSGIKDCTGIVDISRSGLCILTEEAMIQGEDVSMEITPPIGGPIFIDGNSVYSKKESDHFRVGVDFKKDLFVF